MGFLNISQGFAFGPHSSDKIECGQTDQAKPTEKNPEHIVDHTPEKKDQNRHAGDEQHMECQNEVGKQHAFEQAVAFFVFTKHGCTRSCFIVPESVDHLTEVSLRNVVRRVALSHGIQLQNQKIEFFKYGTSAPSQSYRPAGLRSCESLCATAPREEGSRHFSGLVRHAQILGNMPVILQMGMGCPLPGRSSKAPCS
jgi:hypothetical protein